VADVKCGVYGIHHPFSIVVTMFENLFIGIISGFIASVLFVGFLYRLRPNIVIAPEIAKRTKADGVPHYSFKIVNLTPYPVVDLRIEFVIYTPRNIANGQINDAKILLTADRFQLDSSKALSEPFGNEAWYTYAGHLEDEWNDDSQHLVLRVIAKHSLSQFSRVVTQKFHLKRVSIKLGQFSNGPSLTVVAEG
jgi:hypothetical protein